MVYWLQYNNKAKNSCKDEQKSIRPESQQIKQILSCAGQISKTERQGESAE